MRPQGVTPSFDQIIRDIVEDRLYDLNTAMPGKVLAVDNSTGLLQVEPCFMRRYVHDGKPVKLPVLEAVPLANLRAGDAIISMPVKVGDFVTLIFAQRSLDKWKESGRTEAPGDPRLHHISDAIAYPGAYPVSKNIKTDPDALQIKFGGTKITLKKDETLDLEVAKAKINMTKDGKFQIGNGSVNLLQLLKDTLTEVEATAAALKVMTVPTALGPSGVPINAASFTAVETNVKKIAKLLEQILG